MNLMKIQPRLRLASVQGRKEEGKTDGKGECLPTLPGSVLLHWFHRVVRYSGLAVRHTVFPPVVWGSNTILGKLLCCCVCASHARNVKQLLHVLNVGGLLHSFISKKGGNE